MLKKNFKFYVKTHDENLIVAICDSDLIGKTFEEKDLQLKVSENFYKGILLNEEEIIEIMKQAKNLNLVGTNIIELGLKLNLIEKEHILYINKIPHAQVFELW
ncbi:MAG: DUF424 family protein [Candidatus Nanoarchaeia archaeon]|nr:DUF424 family protein [Candidatus Nanoarchaeia archaeon]